MRHRSLAALVWTAAAIPAYSATLLLQVCDVRDQPMSGVVLTAKSSGSTSPPTDVAGKTQIMLLPNLLPGEPVSLVLVRAPRAGLQIYSPWEGSATIPNPNYALAVVLGSRGDRAALENRRVTDSLAEAVLKKQENHLPAGAFGRAMPSKRKGLNALSDVSMDAGLDPLQVDDAIRKWADNPVPKGESGAFTRYVKVMPSHESLVRYSDRVDAKQK